METRKVKRDHGWGSSEEGIVRHKYNEWKNRGTCIGKGDGRQ